MVRLVALALAMVCGCLASPLADHGYGAPAASYSAPSHVSPTYHSSGEVRHTHHHYYYPEQEYHAPIRHHPQPVYHAPVHSYAPHYGYYEEDPYIHLHKKELAKSTLLFGTGLLKGVLLTALINNNNGNGITIG